MTRPASILRWAFILASLAFILLPTLIIIPLSFNDRSYFVFPPDRYSLRWYYDFFQSPEWMDSLWASLRIGLAAAILTTLAGTALAFYCQRSQSLVARVASVAVLGPAIVPVIVLAIGAFDIFARLGLLYSQASIVLMHSVLALPFVFLVVRARIGDLDPDLEAAAASLGATPLEALRLVVLPQIAPTLVAAAVLGFIISFDEVVVTSFLAGGDLVTLPVRMFSYITTTIRPTVAAISVLFLLLTTILLLCVYALGRRGARPNREQAQH
jgi:putative spermidine/putrescine transport system permease protein